VNPGLLRQRRKAKRRIDKVAQNLATQRRLARQQSLDRIAQKSATKLGIASYPRLHRLPKIPRQRHEFHIKLTLFISRRRIRQFAVQ